MAADVSTNSVIQAVAPVVPAATRAPKKATTAKFTMPATETDLVEPPQQQEPPGAFAPEKAPSENNVDQSQPGQPAEQKTGSDNTGPVPKKAEQAPAEPLVLKTPAELPANPADLAPTSENPPILTSLSSHTAQNEPQAENTKAELPQLQTPDTPLAPLPAQGKNNQFVNTNAPLPPAPSSQARSVSPEQQLKSPGLPQPAPADTPSPSDSKVPSPGAQQQLPRQSAEDLPAVPTNSEPQPTRSNQQNTQSQTPPDPGVSSQPQTKKQADVPQFPAQPTHNQDQLAKSDAPSATVIPASKPAAPAQPATAAQSGNPTLPAADTTESSTDHSSQSPQPTDLQAGSDQKNTQDSQQTTPSDTPNKPQFSDTVQQTLEDQSNSPKKPPQKTAPEISTDHLDHAPPADTQNNQTQPAPRASAAAAPKDNSTPETQSDPAPTLRDQVQNSIMTSVRDGRRDVTVRLNPPELGKLVVKFQEQNGEITAFMEVARSQTRAEIQQALPKIIQNIQESGVQIKRVEVTLNNNSLQESPKDGGFEQPQQSAQNRQEPADSHPKPGSRWNSTQQNFAPPDAASAFSRPQIHAAQGSIDMLI